MDLDAPQGEMRFVADLRRTGHADTRRPRSPGRKLLGICLLVTVTGGPAGLAARGYFGTNLSTQLQHARVNAAVAGKQSQTIAFGQLPRTVPVAAPVTLSAHATSGLPVSLTSDTPAVCTVSGSAATTVAAGACVITAEQGGSATYAAAPDIAHAFQVRAGKQSQTIAFGQLPRTVPVAAPVTLSAHATSGLPVSFTSDTPAVCTVSGSAATTVAAGACVITAEQGGSATYAAAPDIAHAFQVRAGAKPQRISFAQPPSTQAGVPVTLSASASSGLPVSFTSDTPPVCTVSGTTVVALAAGTCLITAEQGGSATYAAAPDIAHAFQVRAGAKQQRISFAQPPSTQAGVPVTLSASASSGLPVSFTSDTPPVCTVSGTTVVALAAGTCVITAAQGGNATFTAAPDIAHAFQVRAGAKPQRISFAQPPSTQAGVPVTLSASASSGLPVSFTSDTPPVCTVSGTTVVALAAGTCVITAAQGGNATFTAAPDIARSLTVRAAPTAQTITFGQPPAAKVATLVTLSASASSGLLVSFTSYTLRVCTVSGATVTTRAPGACVITASQGGSATFAAAPPVARSFRVRAAQRAQEITFSQLSPATVGTPVTLSASASSGLPVSFTSNTPLECTVSGSTVVTVAAGPCMITASQGGSAVFAKAPDVTQSFRVRAGRAAQIITFSQPLAAKVGVPGTLSASASSGLPLTFVPDTPLVCTVSGSTVVTVAAGVCMITASQGGSPRYAPAPEVTQSFRVRAGGAAQIINFSQPLAAKVGVPVTLSASASSGLPVSFTSRTGLVCTVSGSTVTTSAPGMCKITATQGGSPGYAPAAAVTQSFQVTGPTSTGLGALVILLAAAVPVVAGLSLVVRRWRQRPRPLPTPTPTVHVAPETGPPASVRVHDAGDGAGHTVRIEPSPGTSITTITEADR